METAAFWAAAGGMGLAVAALFVLALIRARSDIAAAADFDLKVYRDQLTEIDRDLARGTLAAEEAERLRTEISRRLLDADRHAQTATRQGSTGGIALAAALILALIGGSYWTYLRLGAPGYPDLPLATRFAMSEEMRANRPSQAEMEAEAAATRPAPLTPEPDFAALMDQLRQTVADRPEDARGLELLATNEARLGNLTAARTAMESLLRVKGDSATAEDHAALAELMIMAAGGLVSPEAEAELTRALTLDAGNGTARYYYGLMAAQVGRFDRTFALWRPLLDEGPADAPWIAPIRAQIEDVAMRAGVQFTLPDAPPGPDADAIAAAEDMSPEDRQAMVEGMVAQLGNRLATEGGTVEEWARLIASLATLDRKAEAQEIYAEALLRFEGSPSQQSFLREQALNAGLTP
ncbi:c-type cytochrome biogenesis protein CcmI [Tabrizicola sp. TH137]|uniref:c-type cytochrome biogenesis protein CcmI n=1 Tax=Tabrizicola sp. TH137 TaxID=2067452 RepID=UPI000C7E2B8A|nr:c-type cytochrome biogenesis protein CcmI [Tabrizicola sp. TH137]PLL13094.1 c-type cytochrome biogenesis protein CcmI [Tabrizicola sp. TH137]